MKVQVIRKHFLAILVLGLAGTMVGCSKVQATSSPGPTGASGATIQAAIDALGNAGGIVQLPCQTVYFNQTITIRNPVDVRGCGTTIGAPLNEVYNGVPVHPEFPGTRLVWTGGQGIAIDIGPQSHDAGARGTVLRDFNLENQGDGTIGIRINTQEPRLINVYVLSLGDATPGKPFSTAGMVIGDLGLVNDFLCRDCYVRFQQDGIQLLSVSEATIDHSRILENFGNNIVVGDPNNIANNIQIVNGTNFSNVNCETCAQVGTGAGIKITRASNIVNVTDGYCESNPGTYCIDATNVVGGNLNQLNVRDTYFATGGGSTARAAYAIGLNAPSANVVVSGNVFLGQTTAGVFNEKSGALFSEFNLLRTGPLR